MRLILYLISILFCINCATNFQTNGTITDVMPNLPEQHLLRYLNTFPNIKAECQKSENCQLSPNIFTNVNASRACWGFEYGCEVNRRFKTPTCNGAHVGWMSSKSEQLETFYNQADFGYIRQQVEELTVMCKPKYIDDSSLLCTKYLRFCSGRNLLIDFRDLPKRKELIRYQMDVLKPEQILGHCELNSSRLLEEMDHMGALQSWAPELRNFRTYEKSPILADSQLCDIIVKEPMFIMKIDSTYNMYHHFCDFFNLYISLFVNQTHPLAFDTNVRILIWETYPYDSPFAVAYKAFTKHEIWTLNEVSGKRVCFKNLVLPLLPRMIFGLYYNTPLVSIVLETK